MKDKIKDLFTLDNFRIGEIFEITQFSILYIMICLVFGIYLDYIFPDPDDTKSTIHILLELSLHSVIVALSVVAPIPVFAASVKYPLNVFIIASSY